MAGLVTYYVLTFMRVASRQVCIAGITPWPDAAWMEQMARNVSHAEDGFLNGFRYLLRPYGTFRKLSRLHYAASRTLIVPFSPRDCCE
jgi:hypothetical protein